jgi:uncharacterized protein (DUF433 family)
MLYVGLCILETPQSTERHMAYSQIITIEPGKRSGKPCIRGIK